MIASDRQNAHSRPRILVVSPTPPPHSGPEVMTAQLLHSPLKDRCRLIHFNISKQREVNTKARFDLTNVLYGLFQPLQLFWLMVRHRPDVVYTNLAQNLAGFLRYASFVLTVALFRKPVVVRVMGDGFKQFYARANPILRWLILLTLGRIDRFIVRAEILKKQFDHLVPPDKLRVVYSGIDTTMFERPRVRANDEEIRVLFVGYLTKAKGALDLLKTVPMVSARCPGARFHLMGSKLDVERNITYVHNPHSNEAILRQLLARQEIADHVKLLGVQTGQEKINSFVNADIFVLPSYAEAFPTVVLEAMAAGLPIVATPVGALPEAFDERNILFVEPGNLSQLAAAILALAQDRTRRLEMGTLNRQLVQQHFDLSAYAARVEAVFAEVRAAPLPFVEAAESGRN